MRSLTNDGGQTAPVMLKLGTLPLSAQCVGALYVRVLLAPKKSGDHSIETRIDSTRPSNSALP